MVWGLSVYCDCNMNCARLFTHQVACFSGCFTQWKALKCQTLGAAVHVIVLVCWQESVTASWLPACHAHAFCFVPAYRGVCKVCSQISDALSQALCNLRLAFLADFIAFSRKLHSAFRLERKTWSQRSHVFRHTSFALRAYLFWRHIYCHWPIIEGTAALHCGHTFVGGVFTANGQ